MIVGRNDPCPCNSGKKYKKCCIPKRNSNDDTNNNRMDLVIEKYKDLDDNDIIERFALGKYEEAKHRIEIQDFNLNDSQKEMFQQTSEINSIYKKINDLYTMYLSDFADFNKKFLSLEKGEIKISQDNNGSDFNRLFIHVLSSARLFLTFMENDLQKRYGIDSKEFRDWKTITGEMFDNSFPYRFGYHLRNYTQHSGLPIAAISATVIDNDPKKVCKCKMTLNSQYLLQSGYNWNKNVAKDLRDINGEIDLKEILNGLMSSMIPIFGKINEIFILSFDKDLKKIEKNLKGIYSMEHQPFISRISKFDLINSPTNFTLIPLQGLREIMTIYLELGKMGLVKIDYH